MTLPAKILYVEVTQVVPIALDLERERLNSNFKGKLRERLLAMLDDVEAGRLYEAAKTYFNDFTRDEREYVNMGMSEVFDKMMEMRLGQMAWEDRPDGALYAQVPNGRLVSEVSKDYPRCSVVSSSLAVKPSEDNVEAGPSM